jgi:hypothetical protein
LKPSEHQRRHLNNSIQALAIVVTAIVGVITMIMIAIDLAVPDEVIQATLGKIDLIQTAVVILLIVEFIRFAAWIWRQFRLLAE